MLTIKEWAVEDRPREKLLSKGIVALSDAELLAILIGTGTRSQTALELAQNVLELTQYQLNELGKKSVRDLQVVKGIGEAKAIGIVAALELGRRRKQEAIIERKELRSSALIAELFQSKLGDLPHEELWVLLLNCSLKMISTTKIAGGGTATVSADIRMILQPAIEQLAHAIVLVHNHPSGSLVPSPEDEKLTQKLRQAVKFFDIEFSDHIIVTDNGYYSFADEGKMGKG